MDDRGLHHSSAALRSRVSYFFSRFVKSQKTLLQPYIEEVLKQIADLLDVSASEISLVTAEDKLFLYEATGMLIVTGSFTPDQKQQYMQQLLGNLWDRFSAACQQLNEIQAGRRFNEMQADRQSNEMQADLGHQSNEMQIGQQSNEARAAADQQKVLYDYLNNIIAFARYCIMFII